MGRRRKVYPIVFSLASRSFVSNHRKIIIRESFFVYGGTPFVRTREWESDCIFFDDRQNILGGCYYPSFFPSLYTAVPISSQGNKANYCKLRSKVGTQWNISQLLPLLLLLHIHCAVQNVGPKHNVIGPISWRTCSTYYVSGYGRIGRESNFSPLLLLNARVN